MKNPYNVLNISENATDEEVKEAYRNLARKYQSDSYSSGPLAEIAAKKMRELDEAYDAIILNRRSSGNNGSSNTGNYKSTGTHSSGYQQYKNTSSFADIRAKISANRIDDAETLLDGVPKTMRDAEWYFLKGTVQYRRGWFEEAQKNYATACSMDPDNGEYKAAFNQVTNPRAGGYRTRQTNSGCSGCDICSSLICADCCCECFGGDLIPCC